MDTSTAKLTWSSFPGELRLLILECVIPQHERTAGFPSASCLATVSREWQCFFEEHTFRRLALSASDVPTFAKAVRKKNTVRLNYITHLSIDIELAPYAHRGLIFPDRPWAVAQNFQVFTCSMRQLLNALSSWRGIRGGLTLEISARSPSDVRNGYREFEMDDDYPFRFEDGRNTRPNLVLDILRRLPIWFHVHEALNEEMQRQYGAPLEFRPRSPRNPIPALSKAPIVKGLLMRRQFFRGIALPSLAKLLRESLVALEWFRLERWAATTEELEEAFYTDFQAHLMPALPASVERFYFNQWPRSPSCHRLLQNQEHIFISLSRLMATWCHRFAEFCPPHHLHEDEFLNQLIRDGASEEESKVELLSLRSVRLRPSATQGSITALLVLAASAARTLPRLRSMEMWNARPGYAFLFRYTKGDRKATITWRSDGQAFCIEPEVVKAWASIAPAGQLAVQSIPFAEAGGEEPAAKFKTIYRHLGLPTLAFDPVTMAQLEGQVVAQYGG
ncbi:hypothetical protein ACJZ2D_009376 [Fusarium nematophilum]